MRLSAVVRLANFNANEQDVAMAMKTAPIEPNAKPKKWNDKFFTQGYTFWGADSLRTFNTQSRQGCQKVCRDNPVCTGVTYTTSCMRSAGCAKDTDLYMSPTHRIMGSDSRSEPRPQVVATVAASSTSSTRTTLEIQPKDARNPEFAIQATFSIRPALGDIGSDRGFISLESAQDPGMFIVGTTVLQKNPDGDDLNFVQLQMCVVAPEEQKAAVFLPWSALADGLVVTPPVRNPAPAAWGGCLDAQIKGKTITQGSHGTGPHVMNKLTHVAILLIAKDISRSHLMAKLCMKPPTNSCLCAVKGPLYGSDPWFPTCDAAVSCCSSCQLQCE